MPTPSLADADLSIPELMRVARGSYKRAIDAQLAACGIDDLPRGGGFMLARLASGDPAIPETLRRLGVNQTALSELADGLVVRGFVARAIDPNDGTVAFALTERGRATAEAVFEGARRVDEELRRRLTAPEIAALRRGLVALAEIKESLQRP